VVSMPACSVQGKGQRHGVQARTSEDAVTGVVTWGKHVVTRDSPVPLYRQITSAISEMIVSGQLAPQTLLPSEKDLAALYGVSRLTVRQAISELQRMELVETRHGKGTAVKCVAVEPTSCLASFTETQLRAGREPRTKIISFGHIVDREIAEHLGVPGTTSLVQVVRLRLVDDQPVYLSFVYIPAFLAPSLCRKDFLEKGICQSLFHVLERNCGLRLSAGEESVSATAASERDAQLLGVPPLCPLVERTCTMASGGGKPVVFERSLWVQSQSYRVRLMWRGTLQSNTVG